MMAQENVFLFVPNLLGYLRVILAIAAFALIMKHPGLAAFLYFLSSFLDALDGHLARSFSQCSKFGATFDMLIDRCGTMCLLIVLAVIYSDYFLVFQFLCTLDIASHWLHMYSSLTKGETSHKSTDVTAHPLLRLYYTKTVLFIVCSGNELFFIVLYLLNFYEGPELPLGQFSIGLWRLCAYLFLPICVLKQVVSVIQMIGAAQQIAAIDLQERHK
ncbi:CDP-diacylglycerol--inositol 3-phosphatidyltransferase-like [Oscarella lobularis]|uniref:CDP-diacylglycerol--inositol 3-phosphatidyltransferase-like n=1 Tax=Oscarella lobularis TaxID=121494 RepID=UPI003313A8AB